MDCAIAREAVSAILDGEDPGADADDVDLHLESCGACREWRDAAYEVTRRARLGVARPAARRTEEVAAAVRARDRRRWRPRPGVLPRLGLAVVAAGQLAVALPCLLLGTYHGAPVHVAHEMGSLDAALAVGFLVTAWRPARARGMRPLVGVAAALLVITAVADLAGGRTTAVDEAPHLLVLTGWLFTHRLTVTTPPAVAEPRPALMGALWARLRRPAGIPERSGRSGMRILAAAAPPGEAAGGNGVVPATPAAAAPPGEATGGNGVVPATPAAGLPAPSGVPARCGCATAHCSCPGCAAPAAAG